MRLRLVGLTAGFAASTLGWLTALAVPSGAQPVVDVTPDSLTFTAMQGAAAPEPQVLSVRVGTTPGQWVATSDEAWLEVTPSSGTSGETLVASVRPSTLAAGRHAATIKIESAHGGSAAVAVRLHVGHHPILRTYSVIELGRQLGSLTGILAGFALTVVILLIDKSGGDNVSHRFLQASIASFFVAFATSLETAFNFIVIGAETENSVRIAVQLIPVVLGLSIAIAYLFMGIALALFEYHVADQMRVFIGLFCFAALAFLGLNASFSTVWSVAVWEETLLGALTDRSPGFSYGLLFLAIIPAIIVLLRISTSRREPSIRSDRFYVPIAMVALVVVTVTSVLASFIAEEVPLWMQGNMRAVGWGTVALYVLVAGAAAASLPCYEPAPLSEGDAATSAADS